MKTKNSFRFLPVLVLVTVLVSSCSKDSSDDNFSVSSDLSTVGSDYQVGSIIDLGLVTENIHQMLLTLNQSVNAYDINTGDLTGATNSISLLVYTDDDGHIPTGSYYYSDSQDIAPFTFGMQGISFKPADNGMVLDQQTISYGLVDIVHTGDQYSVSVSIALNSGNSINGAATGKMTYSDQQQ